MDRRPVRGGLARSGRRPGVEALARAEAAAAGLEIAVSYHDDFAACTNDAAAVAVLARACAAQGLVMGDAGLPMRASEDFGRFGTVARSAMFLLGAAESAPVLHGPDYDFADDRIGPGVRVFDTVPRDLLG